MKHLGLTLIPALLWLNVANANLPSNGGLGPEGNAALNEIRGLNQADPDLKLKPRMDLSQRLNAQQTLLDLQGLELDLSGRKTLPPESLISLTCNKPCCFRDDSE